MYLKLEKNQERHDPGLPGPPRFHGLGPAGLEEFSIWGPAARVLLHGVEFCILLARPG